MPEHEAADAVTLARAGVRAAESVNARIYPQRVVQRWLATPINTPSRIGGTVLTSILTTRDNTPAIRAVLSEGAIGLAHSASDAVESVDVVFTPRWLKGCRAVMREMVPF
ncbi:MAG: hypothetical protein M0Z36_06310 [Thermaerobacter sp.]|nr:hypothetical protein [Thermaerobacter sp.]